MWISISGDPALSHILSSSSAHFAQLSLLLQIPLLVTEPFYSFSKILLRLTLSQDFSIPPSTTPPKFIWLDIGVQWTLFFFKGFSPHFWSLPIFLYQSEARAHLKISQESVSKSQHDRLDGKALPQQG